MPGAVNMEWQTKEQAALMDALVGYIVQHDCSPSYDDLADKMGLASKSGIKRKVDKLYERGAVTFRPNCSPSIAPTIEYWRYRHHVALASITAVLGAEATVDAVMATAKGLKHIAGSHPAYSIGVSGA